jgi:predicted glycosyltransferase
LIILKTGNKTVLICPLDWGLGHASRVIPIVHNFVSSGYDVVLGGSGKSAVLLQNTFKDVPFILFPSFSPVYTFRGIFFFLNILFQLPAMMYATFREHYLLKKKIKPLGIEMVISDNRYGLYSDKTRNIIITHQISPVFPHFLRWAEYPVHKIIKYLITRFDECWIPDNSTDNNLSGMLSHRYALPGNARFIGLLSRFMMVKGGPGKKHYDVVIVLSGPQPELQRLTHRVIDQASQSKLKILVICGLQDSSYKPFGNPELEIVPHLEITDFRNVIMNSSLIISTAGYTGIMDLAYLGKAAVLIPSHGQSEQEYLSNYLHARKMFLRVTGQNINLKHTGTYIRELKKCKPFMAGLENMEDLNYFKTKTNTITESPRRNPL